MLRKAPPSRFLADEQGLDVAASIANALGLELDREKTRKRADAIHRDYFDRIVRILSLGRSAIDFDSAASRRISAFAGISRQSGREIVFFEEQLDFWLFSLCHLVSIVACIRPDHWSIDAIGRMFLAQLDIRADPKTHEKIRDEFIPYLLDYNVCLELSHAMSRAMIVFVLCHKIAHIESGHLGAEHSQALELEADALGARFFVGIMEAGSEAGAIFVHRKLICAPILLMRFLAASEVRLQALSAGFDRGGSQSHPDPSLRAEHLASVLSTHLEGDVLYLLKSCEDALSEILGFADIAIP